MRIVAVFGMESAFHFHAFNLFVSFFLMFHLFFSLVDRGKAFLLLMLFII